MAKPGLSFENPLYQASGGTPAGFANPYTGVNPAASSGSDALQRGLADIAVMGQTARQQLQTQFSMPGMQTPAKPPGGDNVYFDSTRRKFYVNGVEIDEDDDRRIMESAPLLGRPSVGAPQGSGWVAVPSEMYQGYIQEIQQPGLGRLASKSFGRGVDQLQMLAGRGLQLAGAEELGGRIVEQQEADLARTAPYERQFTDIESGRGAVEWLVANFAQQGPNLIESIATAGAGFLAGTAATGNPLGGAAAALAATIGKTTWKEGVKAALKKKAAGETLDQAENKLLRNAAGVGMATAATFGQGLATGAADIYGELREQGADADDVSARLTALAGSVPYAVADLLPEYLLFSRLLGKGARPELASLATRRGRAGEILKRGAIGGGIGGAAGGFGEVSQEALLLGLSDQDFSNPENVNRLINSFAAGAAVSGPIGAGANILNPTNLLQKGSATQPLAGEQELKQTPKIALTPPAPIPTTAQMDLPLAGGMVSYTPTEFAPGPQPGAQGVLDVGLPGQPLAPQEVAARQQGLPAAPIADTRVAEQMDLFAPTQPPGMQQMPFQFAPEAPTGIGFTEQQPVPNTVMAQQLQAALRQQQTQQAQQQRAQQEAAQREADLQRLAVQAQNQRQLDIAAQQAEPPAPFPSMPMRQAGPTQPVQLPLFGGGLPRPTRGERLRAAQPLPTTTALPEGTLLTQPAQQEVAGETRADLEQERDQLQRIVAAYQSKGTNRITAPIRDNAIKRLREIEKTLAAMPAEDRGLRQASTQLPMFTQAGEPTLPALRAAGARTKVAPTPPKPRAAQTPGARGLRRGAKVAEIITLPTPTYTPATAVLSIGTFRYDDGSRGAIIKLNNGKSIEAVFLDAPSMPELEGWLVAGQNLGTDIQEVARNVLVLDAQSPLPAARPEIAGLRVRTESFVTRRKDQLEAEEDAAERRPIGRKDEAPKPTAAKVTRLKVKETPSAVPKPSPAKVSPRKQPEAGKGVGAEVPAKGKAAPKGEALKAKTEKPAAKKPLKKEAPQPPKAVAAPAAAPAVTETPAETWDAMDTGVEWTALSPEQQTRWTDSDRTQNTADTVAEDVRSPQTPEALWEDMKPEGAPAYNDLPAPVRAQWRQDATAGKATIQRAEEILGDVEETPLQLVNSEFASAESATDIRDFRDAIGTVVEFAYFTSEETNTKAAVVRARELLANTSFTDAQQNAIDAALLDLVNALKDVEAVYTRGATKGDSKPWFDYATQRGLLPQITTVVKGLSIDAATKMLDSGQLRVANLPADTVKKYKASVGPVSGIIGKAGANLKNDTRSNPATTLADYIKELNTKTVPLNKTQRENATKKLRDLWAAARAAGMEDFADQNGIALADYFDASGNPHTGTIKGIFRVATEEVTDAVQAEREQIIDEDNIAADDDYEAPFSMDDWNASGPADDWNGRYFRDDGTPINSPIPLGRVKMLVSVFLSKLGIKPKVQVYRNQADFKAKNPKLYAQAAASRPQGDFDTASAVGFSFGDGNVIIFADRVATEQQLKFVLAHETLGHFGFRGLLTEKELNAALDGVYNSSPKVKAAVDTAMKARKMSRQEATEEYLADFAGMLDTNIIARFWNAVKNALNKLGMTFEDDMARYLVSQSRRYVRNGTTSGTFMDFKAMAQRMSAIEGITDPDGAGRFALASENYSAANMLAAAEAQAQRSFNLFDLTATLQKVKDAGINLGDTWERVKSELQTVNFASRENQGYRALYNILRDTGQSAARLRAKYNQMMDTVLSPAVEVAGRGFTQGATKEQIDTTSAMLRDSSAAKFANLTDTELRKMGSLVKVAGGVVSIDPAVLKALQARGRFTLEQFKKGFTYTTLVSMPATEAYRTGLRTQRDAELAAAKTDEERKAINKDYTARLEDPSMEVPQEQSSPAMPDLTDKSPEWIMYNEVRDTMDASAIDLLLANYTQAQETRKNVKRKAAAFLDRALTENDEAFLTRIEDKYTSLYTENSVVNADGSVTVNREARKNAEDFIKKFNTALLGRDTDRNADVQEFFDKAEADDVFKGIEGLKADSKIKYGDKDTMFSVQQAIANIVAAEESRNGAEQFAKRSIAGGYVPFGRSGSWQVRVQAVDPKTGRIYKVSDEYRARLFFAQTPTKADSINIAASVQAVFDRNEDGFEMEVLDGTEYVIKKVKLVAQPETARQTVSTTAEANLNEILAAITRFSISITPEERERLLVGLTTQNARARSRLQRKGTPGEDPNTIKYVSEHLESNASVVARKQNRHRLDRLFDESDGESRRLWRGDKVEYDKRKAAWEAAQKDPTIPEAQRLAAKREFDDYHFTFVTNKSEEQGNKYIDRGRRLVNFMEAQTNVDYTDFGSGETVSTIRTWTTFAFMGASFATAVLNYVALATNVFPALMGYNQKNAFGGGFGLSMSSIEITRAMAATKGFGQSEVKFWDDLLAGTPDKIKAKLKASGFSEAEARFMQKEVSGGVMQAALTNSLIGSARGKFRSGFAKKGAEFWMGMFNYTEQHSRRATGLAAFRMAYARALVEGKDVDTAFEVADKFAVDMIDNTLGEYAMFNRPAMFRGGVQQFLFMFKMFPVNSVQMLAALPRQEQLLALGILALFSGLKGLPFAEDLMDLLDTIAQALGLGPNKVWKGSAEKTLAEALDAIAPGMTPLLMRGVLNTFTPANVADRVSLSNIIPGTGIALAGADVGRELIEIAGPVASFLQGAAAMSANVTRYGLETVGLLDDKTSLTGIARESPVAMLRALGDMAAYNNAGAIVSQKGFVVSEDLHLGTMLTRALGFYPASAVAENDVVRLAKRVGDYQKDVAATYRGLYVSAKIAKDEGRAREVVEMVKDWNEAAEGTGLEIRNFNQSANRALREAQRTATERFLRTQPKAMRPETERMLELYGVTE